MTYDPGADDPVGAPKPPAVFFWVAEDSEANADAGAVSVPGETVMEGLVISEGFFGAVPATDEAVEAGRPQLAGFQLDVAQPPGQPVPPVRHPDRLARSITKIVH